VRVESGVAAVMAFAAHEADVGVGATVTLDQEPLQTDVMGDRLVDIDVGAAEFNADAVAAGVGELTADGADVGAVTEVQSDEVVGGTTHPAAEGGGIEIEQ